MWMAPATWPCQLSDGLLRTEIFIMWLARFAFALFTVLVNGSLHSTVW
jgi:hypothetical protein